MKIYYAEIGGLTEEDMQLARNLLPKERIEKIERKKQKKSQRQSVSAGLLLECALQECGLTGKELTFLTNEDGKPYIAEYPEFFYNISHSKDYVVLVVDENPVGIDIEHLRIGGQKLVERFFSEDERLLLKENWSDQLFTKLWTRKESFLKAVGCGMRMSLAGFSTVEEAVGLNDRNCTEMIEDGAVYYLDSIQLGQEYWLSVCRKNIPVVMGREVLRPQRVELEKILEKV